MSADHLPGHTVVDSYGDQVLLCYRRPRSHAPGPSGEFVRLLYTPAAALALAEELTRVARALSPEGSEAPHG
ncbi:hypothetical protein [Azospirillum picis]|uniref:DUF2470 domain-containing protein n=1 Tax=Azospirillum picis TaxID=488438 RepID=A0ABU0MRV8_9PROT|nr:hypothetical protein [Azospirillum picis]MBP2302548.1 hypothetical protein [Azospirillum picis]MDQ0536210.1 hypothetical protein [Azospirillum picis]